MGLAALILLAIAPLALPRWTVELPAAVTQPLAAKEFTSAPVPSVSASTSATVKSGARAASSALTPTASAIDGVTLTVAIYGLIAVVLLAITVIALGRLVMLQARADVLVDGHWLSALARAQRRMGFKHGTALLTTDELASPISWGLMRPVILLNRRAVEASDEAEAIIAHELAHVARMDWIKLLLARVACALFWFNPLVWLLAREAHQLREEAADDAVLAADIADTDYAQLLVGVARHECPGLLLGAHGVAPSKNSLARRVARVLDAASARSPAARPFALGVLAGAVIFAAPLAAMTFIGKAPKVTNVSLPKGANFAPTTPYYDASEVPTDLPSIISQGVSTSVGAAVNAVLTGDDDFESIAPSGASIVRKNGVEVRRAPSGATVTIYPPDSTGRRKVVAVAPNGASMTTYQRDGDSGDRDDALHQMVQMKAVGLTPDYIDAMRAASPALRQADTHDFIKLRALNVSPAYVANLNAAGFGNLDAHDLVHAAGVGLDGNYIRSMRAAGFDADLDGYIQMLAVGVDAQYVEAFRRAGYKIRDNDQLIELKAMGVDIDELRTKPPKPPKTPPSLPDDQDD
jgi:beta-lactamase regulating signal transducer with metallopeptidase domain